MTREITPGELRETRKARGMTLEATAREMEVSLMTVSNWERGRRHPTGLYARMVRAWVRGEMPFEHHKGEDR